MDEALTVLQQLWRRARRNFSRLAQHGRERLRDPPDRNGLEMLTVEAHQGSLGRAAEIVSFFQYRIEDRGEIARRGIDDLQDLGSSGLLLQSLARLGQEPRVLHRDDRLRGKILQQRDLLVGKRSNFLAVGHKGSEKRIILAQWHQEERAYPA